jgi:hypothetical protein
MSETKFPVLVKLESKKQKPSWRLGIFREGKMKKNNVPAIIAATKIAKISESFHGNLIVASGGDIGVYAANKDGIIKIGDTNGELIREFSENRLFDKHEIEEAIFGFADWQWWKSVPKDLVFMEYPKKFDPRVFIPPTSQLLKRIFIQHSRIDAVVGYRGDASIFLPHPDPLKRIHIKFGESGPELRWVWRDPTIAALAKAMGTTDVPGIINLPN